MPATAALCRMNRRLMTCHCLRAFVASKPPASATGAPGPPEAGGAALIMSVKANPRVQDRVQNVGDEVEQDDRDGGHHQEAEHHVGLFLVDRIQEHPAH